MKTSTKIIIPIVAVLVIAVGIYFGNYYFTYSRYDGYKQFIAEDDEYEKGTAFQAKTNDNKVPGMELVAENDNFSLYTNTQTAAVAVYDKRNGEITYSNPDKPEEDIIAVSVYEQSKLKSQLILTYYNASRELTSWYSYTDAVEKGQFEVESIENGVRYIYEFGNLESETGIIPLYISEDRFEEVLGKMSKDSAKALRSLYSKSTSVAGFMEIGEDSIVGHASTKRKLTAYFEEAGYTQEDCENDVLASGVEGVLPITFTVPLEYRLVDDGVQVNIPVSHIEEGGGGKIANIEVLNMFGAVKAPDSKLIVKQATEAEEEGSTEGTDDAAATDDTTAVDNTTTVDDAATETPTATDAATVTPAPADDADVTTLLPETTEAVAEVPASEATDAETTTLLPETTDAVAPAPTETPAATDNAAVPLDNAPADVAVDANGDGEITIDELPSFVDTSVVAPDEIEGYLVLPSGSGSLMNFNNGKTDSEVYNEYVYGIDPMDADYTVTQNTENVRLPVFGIQKLQGNVQQKDYGILATIEEGEAFAQITASVSSKGNSYNYAYPTFTLRGDEKLSMFGASGNESDMSVVEKDIYKVNLQVHYSFLDENYAGYSGMANYYREKLIADGDLTLQETAESIPFFMDILGGVKATETFAGIQYMKTIPMTDFEQAGEIADEFYAQDINNITMNFQGWFNGGYYHDMPSSIEKLGVLGGKNKFEALAEKIQSNGGRLYGDVAFQNVTFIAENYNYTAETSRYYGGGVIANFGQVNPVTLRQTASLGYEETLYDLLSPKFLPRYVSKFATEIKKYDITGISLRDLASNLHSDKKRNEFINRYQAQQIVEAQLDILKGTEKKLLANNANAYALKYVDEIVNLPSNNNEYLMIDAEIPFYQMVLHGCIDYAGNAVNLSNSSDKKALELKLIEYGASPHFTFSYEQSNKIKYTGLNKLYSTDYHDWSEEAINLYKNVNDVLSQVAGATMTKHEIVEDGLKKVTYSNGVIIYVNESNTAKNVDGIAIEARNYAIGGNK